MRLFVALDLPEEVRQELRDLIERLSKVCPDARWVRPEGIHITLKFIGHVDAAKADSIRQALEPIRSDRPVEMQFRGLGFFPNERRPRVAWCGVEGSSNLAKLAADIEASRRASRYRARIAAVHASFDPGAHRPRESSPRADREARRERQEIRHPPPSERRGRPNSIFMRA